MKTGILTLNEGSVFKNASLWSHDPSMMWDPVTEKYYSYSTDVYQPEDGLTEKIGIPVRSSKDLIHFEYEGIALSQKAIKEGSVRVKLTDLYEFKNHPFRVADDEKMEETTESIHRL